jgi:Protein of unknown function (DUF3891)
VLIRVDDGGALAIGQLSHAWLSGQLARAWGNAQFGAVEPREEVVLGAQQHDIGWALFDLEPRFNPDTGLPRSFLELSVEEHLAIWRGAPEHLLSQSLYAALVVSMHGSSLSELRARSAPEQAETLQAHIDEERARQAQLCATLGVSDAHAERTRRQMWTWDGLSLALASSWRPFTAHEVPATGRLLDLELRDREDGAVMLDPWPFASQRVEVHCEARRLDARYEDERAMRRAFERANVVTLAFALVAP